VSGISAMAAAVVVFLLLRPVGAMVGCVCKNKMSFDII
jgi:hypothetical protein